MIERTPTMSEEGVRFKLIMRSYPKKGDRIMIGKHTFACEHHKSVKGIVRYLNKETVYTAELYNKGMIVSGEEPFKVGETLYARGNKWVQFEDEAKNNNK